MMNIIHVILLTPAVILPYYLFLVLINLQKDTIKEIWTEYSRYNSFNHIKKETNKLYEEKDEWMNPKTVYAKLLQGSAIFAIWLRPKAEDKIGLVVDLLKQSRLHVEYAFMNCRPLSMKVHSSDFKIIKSLLRNTIMQVEDIAKIYLYNLIFIYSFMHSLFSH